MEAVLVTGRFITEDREPIRGRIAFFPSNVWVEDGDLTYPCLAPQMSLDPYGRFEAWLTPTDAGMYDWFYTVVCPVGTWKITVVGEGPLLLRDLLPKRFSA